MKKELKIFLIFGILVAIAGCRIPFRTATVTVPDEDATGPVITSATFTVLGPGGEIFNLDGSDEIGTINIEQALSLNFTAQDRESGIRSVRLSGEFEFWCGSVGFGTILTWPINVTNDGPAATVGETVRVTAGVTKNFKIADAYEATTCSNPPPRYQDLIGNFTLTATNYNGDETTRTYSITIVPSPTGVTVLE